MIREAQEPRDAPAPLIVGVGASAGGLEAFRRLLSGIDSDSAAALTLLVAQHLDPSHESLLAELLASHTTLTLEEARDGQPLLPDHVYTIAPGTLLRVEAGCLRVERLASPSDSRAAIDTLFRSLADEHGEFAVGVLLSGGGSDGTAGLRAIRAAGGLTIAQEPHTAHNPQMPRHAIEAGVVELVRSLEEIPTILGRYAGSPVRPRVHADELRQFLSDEHLAQIIVLLREHANLDLARYKQGTVRRRIARRMGITGSQDSATYVTRLQQDDEERQQLVNDLLIRVTEFFRDADAFAAIGEHLATLIRDAPSGEVVRAWVPGCATGEEAYSLAILLLEAIEHSSRSVGVQIFATDVDADALAIARAGIYSASATATIEPQRLERFFRAPTERGIQVEQRVRDCVSFALHDLTADPPFSRLDLVSCRNVLIYLRRETQTQVLDLLHFALRPGGLLFLGSSESQSAAGELFTPVSKTWRIFRRKVSAASDRRVAARARRYTRPDGVVEAIEQPIPRRRSQDASMSELARAELVQSWVPPSVIVDRDDHVLYVHGDLTPYLGITAGEPRLELLTMLREDLRVRVRAAIYKGRRDREPVEVTALRDGEGEAEHLRICVRPVATEAFEDAAMVVSFQRAAAEAHDVVQLDATSAAISEQLERELRATREDLRATVEELESSTDELRAAHEESVSMNEELQSANEELEATTEELRALNEEVTTVNVQLQEKVTQLEEAHDDLVNFFASTKLATVFLDESRCIKRLTPAAKTLLRLSDEDLGRCIDDIARPLFDNDLAAAIEAVLDDLRPREAELAAGQQWLSRRVLPYRTEHNRIQGVVIAFHDVTDIKRASEQVLVRQRQQEAVARLGLRALAVSELDALLDEVVGVVRRLLDVELCKILELTPEGDRLLLRSGEGWHEGLVGQAYVPAESGSQAGYTLSTAMPVIVADLATEMRFRGPPLLEEHQVVSGLSCVIRNGGMPYGVIGAHTTAARNFTADDANFLQSVANLVAAAAGRLGADERLRASEAEQRRKALELETIYSSVPVGLALLDRELRYLSINERMALFNGNLPAQHLGRSVSEMLPELAADLIPPLHDVLETGRSLLDIEVSGIRSGTGEEQRFWRCSYVPVIREGFVEAISCTVADVTEQRLAENERDRLLEHTAALRLEAEAAREQLFRLFAQAPANITVHRGPNHVCEFINELALRAVGKPMLGLPLKEVLPELVDQGLFERFDYVYRTGNPSAAAEVEYTWLRDGHTESGFFNQIMQPWFDTDGTVQGVMSFSFDVSEQVRTRRTLEDRERRLQLAIDASEAGVLQHRLPLDGYTFINHRLAELLGVELEDIPDHRGLLPWLQERIDPVEFSRVERSYSEFIAHGRGRCTMELRVRHEQGQLVTLRVVAGISNRNDSGSPTEIGGVVFDVTAARNAEEELRAREERFRALFEQATIGIAVSDESGAIRAVNPALIALLEHPRDQLEARSIASLLTVESAQPVLAALRERTLPLVLDTRFVREDGVQLWTKLRVTPLDPRASRSDLLWLIEDITDRKRYEQALEDALRHKDDFLAMLGHELRNPLGALRNAAQVQKLLDLEHPMLARTCDIIDRQTLHMGKILDGLLDVSRITRGKLRLDEQRLELAALIRTAVEDQRSACDDAGLALEVDIPDAPLWVNGDPVRLTQVMSNLLANAIKYTTSPGVVTVRVSRGDGDVKIAVRDTGVGIDAELLPTIFEPFRQGAQPLDRAAGGLGLGLALVKGLIELHGGRVEARSAGLGHGAELRVSLPLLASAAAISSTTAVEAHLERRRVVVVDDNVDAAEMLAQILELLGCEARVAHDGPDALAVIAAFAPEVVFCDIGLPDGMSGYDIARSLRQSHDRSLRLIAVTGYGRPEDREQALDAGFDEHATKPINLELIKRLLEG